MCGCCVPTRPQGSSTTATSSAPTPYATPSVEHRITPHHHHVCVKRGQHDALGFGCILSRAQYCLKAKRCPVNNLAKAIQTAMVLDCAALQLQVLGNLSTFYPGAKCYEVAGFFWWQGDRDSRDMGLSLQYEKNLVALIKSLRVQYVNCIR